MSALTRRVANRFMICQSLASSSTPSSPSKPPTKFSETSTYSRRGLIEKPVRGAASGLKGFYHPSYGWTPDLGDYYDTEAYKRMRNISMLLSIVVFMCYFCILREENDVDRRMERPLYTHVPAMEKQVLEVSSHTWSCSIHNVTTLSILQRDTVARAQ